MAWKALHYSKFSNLVTYIQNLVVFSSPELKAQVSFSDRLSSVMSVCPYVNFSYFRLLLKHHWANLNQTWHKAYLGDGDSYLFK